MMKILMLIIAIYLGLLSANGDEFKILYLTTPSIIIGGNKLQSGDTFSNNSKIEWDHPRQAMKAMNLKTGKQSLFVAEQFNETNSRDIASYLIASKQLSTRKGAIINTLELGHILEGHHYLLDSIIVETLLPVDNNNYFYGSYEYNGEIINKKLKSHEGKLIFDRSLFIIDGKEIEPFDMSLSVWYVEGDKGLKKLLTDSMIIIPLALSK